MVDATISGHDGGPPIPITPLSSVVTTFQVPQSTSGRIPSPVDQPTRLGEDRLQALDAASASAVINPLESDMEPPVGSSGHRRRRSSAQISIDTSNNLASQRRSPQSAASDAKHTLPLEIPEEPKPISHRVSGDEDISSSEDFEMDDLSEDGLQDDEETGLTGKDKRKRRRRKRRNTLLDQRVAGELSTTEEDKKEADKHVLKNMLMNGLFIVLWYIFSLSISIVRSPNPLDCMPHN